MLPLFNNIKQQRDMVSTFGGYNHEGSCAENECFEAENLTSDYFPFLSPRRRRGKVKEGITAVTDMLYKGGLWWLDGGTLYRDGIVIARLNSQTAKSLVGMGSRVYVFPVGFWFDSVAGTRGYINNSCANYETISAGGSAAAQMNLYDRDGNAITTVRTESYYSGDTKPQANDYCYFTVGGENVLRQYSSVQSAWVDVNDSQIEISFDGLEGFAVGDGVHLRINMTCNAWAINKKIFTVNGDWAEADVILTYVDTNKIRFVGSLQAPSATYTNLPIDVSRSMPTMTFVTECNNRLWGCSSSGHEIYASKLGDGTNFNVFKGISTDSYAATVGSDGPFTAAITYNGSPTFFKEKSIIKVYVSSTGAHQLKEIFASGVRADSPNSLKEVDGLLYYKAQSDIMVYDGGYPNTIATNFGDINYTAAVGGSCRHKYYLSMSDGTTYSMFAYDTKYKLWEREDGTHATAFASDGDDLYFADSAAIWSVYGKHLYSLTANEDAIKWSATFGNMGYRVTDRKFISRVAIRLNLEWGSVVGLWVRYDSAGEWINVMNLTGNGIHTESVAFLPHRCDHFTFKLVGRGPALIMGITKTIEEGGDFT